MKKVLTNPVLLYGALLLFIFLYVDSCQREKSESNRYKNNIEILNSELKTGKTKLGQVTAEKKALIVTNEELREQLWVKDDSLQDLTRKFRKVKAAFVIESTINLEPATIKLETANSLGERAFRKVDPYYTLSGAVLPNSVRVDTLSMFNTQRLVLGVHKGFFNNTITAEITNSNPYITTTDLTTQVLTERAKRFGISAYGGYGFNSNFELSPQVGIGLTFDLLRF